MELDPSDREMELDDKRQESRNTTHRSFKSLVPHIQTTNDIALYVGYALSHQYRFKRKTSPWEIEQWNEWELELMVDEFEDDEKVFEDDGGEEVDKNFVENFNIEHQKIDRLYRLIHEFNDMWYYDNWFYLLARMEYKKGDHVFVELEAGCHKNKHWTGNIFVTRLAFVFTRVVYLPCDVETSIYQSLRNDGYAFEEQTEHDRNSAMFCNEPPTLKYLCYDTVYKK